jgi:hypothetical protein
MMYLFIQSLKGSQIAEILELIFGAMPEMVYSFRDVVADPVDGSSPADQHLNVG